MEILIFSIVALIIVYFTIKWVCRFAWFICKSIYRLLSMLFSKRKQNKGNDDKQDIEQLPNFSFDDCFCWELISENLYQLKIKKIKTKIYLLAATNPIHHYMVKGWDNNIIKYTEGNISVNKMFKFKIDGSNREIEFKYPGYNGFIRIKKEDLISTINKINYHSISECYEIKDTVCLMEFDRRYETYKQYGLIEEENKRKRLEILAKERQEREEREAREIREKIIERERKKRKEKEIYNQLLDEGLIYPDETNKRPPIPKDIVDAVWRRDKGKCVYCGSKENLQLDHIIPFSKGGATTFENLQLLCQKCNLKKSNHIG